MHINQIIYYKKNAVLIIGNHLMSALRIRSTVIDHADDATELNKKKCQKNRRRTTGG